MKQHNTGGKPRVSTAQLKFFALLERVVVFIPLEYEIAGLGKSKPRATVAERARLAQSLKSTRL